MGILRGIQLSVLVHACVVGGIGISAVRAAEPMPAFCGMNYSGKNVALVVGTDDYAIFGGIKSLNNAINDAKLIGDVLSKQGFSVRCLFNPTRLTFNEELTGLNTHLAAIQNQFDTRAVIYVAGHGFKDPTTSVDYILLRPEIQRPEGIFDFNTLRGKLEAGRKDVATIVNKFKSPNSPSYLFIFDSCRSILDLPSGANVVRSAGFGPAQNVIVRETAADERVIVFSSDSGGVAADNIPNSDQANGLYASILADFLRMPGIQTGKILGLTNFIVAAYPTGQKPTMYLHVGLSLYNDWYSKPDPTTCELYDSILWSRNPCSNIADAACIKASLCPKLLAAARGPLTAEAKQCLAPYAKKWFRIDYAAICSDVVLSDQNQGFSVSQDVTTANRPNLQVAIDGFLINQRVANVVSTEAISSVRQDIERQLKNAPATKRQNVTQQLRTELIVKQVPDLVNSNVPSPFKVDVQAKGLVVRTLPTDQSDPIKTFNVKDGKIDVECQILQCDEDLVGVRINDGTKTTLGWVERKTIEPKVFADQPLILKYSGSRISPDPEGIAAVVERLKKDAAPRFRRKVQLLISRTRGDGQQALVAAARLNYLTGLFTQAGVKESDISATMLDGDTPNAQAVVYFGPPTSIPFELEDLVAKNPGTFRHGG